MPNVAADQLRALVHGILVAAGAPDRHAVIVSHSLVDAELTGYDSHGVLRLARSIELIRSGRLDPAAQPAIIRETAVAAVVDGAWTFGHVGARFAADLAVRKAREMGMATVSAVHCHHTGRIGEWVEIGAEAGLVAFAVAATGSGMNAVTPFGGAVPTLGTNPIAWAIPRTDERPPIVVDISTSATARGKLVAARSRGEPVPDGWIVDADGRPTTDPNDYFDGGSILPMGGHKGYALSIIVEMLAIGVGGGDLGPTTSFSQSLLMICIDPLALWPGGEHRATIERVAERIAGTPPAPGVDAVLMPGERAHRCRQDRLVHGIPLADQTWETLRGLAAELGVPGDHRSD